MYRQNVSWVSEVTGVICAELNVQVLAVITLHDPSEV
jgi:hypothetical protein